jgi:putative tricarboxylic transport membrane protein
MLRSDRVFGAVLILVAFIYVMSATQIATPFFSDPLGSKTFPIIIGCVAAICGFVMILSPDAEPDWPEGRSLAALAVATAFLVGYAYALKPLGFLLPTAIVSAVISYQISPRPKVALLSGVCISLGLYLLFRYVLGLSLFGLPRWLVG